MAQWFYNHIQAKGVEINPEAVFLKRCKVIKIEPGNQNILQKMNYNLIPQELEMRFVYQEESSEGIQQQGRELRYQETQR